MEGRRAGAGVRRWLLHDWMPRLVFLAVGIAGGLVLGYGLLAAAAPATTAPADALPGFRLLTEAWNTIQRVYVDRAAIIPKKLTYGAIAGMVDALGDTGHSRFLTPEMRKHQQEALRGVLVGIGAELQTKQNQAVIVAPIDGSPAQRAGLRPGDIILKVNGDAVAGLPLDEVVSRITGPANTTVELTILTPSTGSTRDLRLVRSRITLHNVTWHRLPGTRVAHVRIASFSHGVSADLHQALQEIQREGLTGVILDLRNDSGGLFTEAVDTASQFLASGDVLLEKDSAGQVKPVAVRGGAIAPAIPMVGLINGGTASAAEIVAGALQDAHRAALVGEKTFGTGTLLEAFPLSDGSALLLATEEWLTPAGHLIWHRGIPPDVTVPLPSDASPLLPEAEGGMTPAELRSSGDAQLLRALHLLESQVGASAPRPAAPRALPPSWVGRGAVHPPAQSVRLLGPRRAGSPPASG